MEGERGLLVVETRVLMGLCERCVFLRVCVWSRRARELEIVGRVMVYEKSIPKTEFECVDGMEFDYAGVDLFVVAVPWSDRNNTIVIVRYDVINW